MGFPSFLVTFGIGQILIAVMIVEVFSWNCQRPRDVMGIPFVCLVVLTILNIINYIKSNFGNDEKDRETVCNI